MKASIVSIGDEILVGQIIDTNSAWIANALKIEGVSVEEICSISDSEIEIINSLDRLFQKVDLVITTGGLGPTKDDITKKAIAKFLGVAMIYDSDLFGLITKIFERYGRQTTEAHKEQCYMPKDVIKLENQMGTAPGMLFNIKGKYLLSMPGVPYEMKWIFEKSFLDAHLRTWGNKERIANMTLHTIGRGETTIEEEISDVVDNFPENISIAYLPSLGKVRLRLTARGENQNVLVEQLSLESSKIKTILGDLIFGEDEDTLESTVIDLYKSKGLKISTAESCTGGTISKRLTSISGSSSVYIGGIVAYANSIKEQILGVDKDILENYGAVSEQTVKSMVIGAINMTSSDVAIAVSGIAGPTGGSPEKPVGTIWLACGSKDSIHTRKLQLSKDRIKNIEYSTNVAMDMLRKYALYN